MKPAGLSLDFGGHAALDRPSELDLLLGSRGDKDPPLLGPVVRRTRAARVAAEDSDKTPLAAHVLDVLGRRRRDPGMALGWWSESQVVRLV